MKQVLYAKYNRTRKPEFQIGTRIYIENGKKYVEKYALTEAAFGHINNVGRWSDIFSSVYSNVKFQETVVNEDGRVVFVFLEGEKVSDVLVETISEKEKFMETLRDYMDKMYVFDKAHLSSFEKTEKFVEMFGDIDGLEGLEAVDTCNPDMIFDNVFLCEDGMYLIDNEWGLDFPIPVNFIKYRALHYFYTSHISELQDWMTGEEFFKEFGIKDKYIKTFQDMEKAFQEYTHGGRYTDQYVQNTVFFDELLEKKGEAEFARVRIPELQKEVEERNEHIGKLDVRIDDLDTQVLDMSSKLQKVSNKADLYESELKMIKKDNHAKQEYIDTLERISEERRIELDKIRYYKKHPIRRLYRIVRRIGGKVWRKVKPAVRKIITPAVYTKKIEIPKFDNPKVSIVIPVYNEFEYTYGCIKSIIENVKNVSYEIIVGDDMSTDATKKIKKIVKNVKVNINTTDHGFLMNCNRAAKLAEGQYIVFLNNDTLVKEDWLESLVELIESDDTIGMVGSKLVYQEGILQEAGGIVFSDGSGWNYGRNQNPDMAEYNYVKDVDYISGASIMVRKSLWNQLGGFDEQFIPAYYEDTDLAFAIRKLGYRVVYQPKSVVIHFEGVSNGTDENGSGLKAYQKINKEKFLEKWKEELKLQSPSPEELFVARERSQNKKTVLFIDHYVPHFDQDAGSRSTFSYIKVFQHMGYNVKFIGDNFYPHEPYTSALQQMGIEVLYGDWYYLNWQTWIEEHAKDIDVVFANRPHITMKYIDLLKEKTNAKIIYYGHDLHHIREMREYEITKNEELLDSAKYWKKIEYDIMEKADVIFYPSYVEINEIVKNRPEFKDKARAIPVYMYEEPHKADVKLSAKEKKDLMFVGGFAHKPNADAVCWFVENVFPQVLEKYPDIKLNVIGSKPTQEVLDLASENIIVHGFVSDEELENFYHNTRMSVVPLRYGAGMKGKVVEAMYYQIPLITTSIGAEGMPEAESVMVICDEADEMAKNIIDLYENYDVLDEMSKKTVDYIEQYFSESAAEKIVKLC